MSKDNSRLTVDDVLSQIQVDADNFFFNFDAHYPRGSNQRMTLAEVLLWAILQELKRLNENPKH